MVRIHRILASGEYLGRSKIQEKEIWVSGMKIEFWGGMDTKYEDFVLTLSSHRVSITEKSINRQTNTVDVSQSLPLGTSLFGQKTHEGKCGSSYGSSAWV